MINSKTFWDKSAKKYAKRPIKDQATYQKKLKITQEYFCSDSYVLEIGCGSGSTAIFHSPYVKDIVATDISDEMIKIAQMKAVEAGVENIHFQQGTLDNLNLPNEGFDTVLALNVLHLLEDTDNSIDKIHRLLKSNGFFISSTPLTGEINRVFHWLIPIMQYLGLAPYVATLTKNQLITKLVAAGFTIEQEWQSSRESLFIVAKKAT